MHRLTIIEGDKILEILCFEETETLEAIMFKVWNVLLEGTTPRKDSGRNRLMLYDDDYLVIGRSVPDVGTKHTIKVLGDDWKMLTDDLTDVMRWLAGCFDCTDTLRLSSIGGDIETRY